MEIIQSRLLIQEVNEKMNMKKKSALLGLTALIILAPAMMITPAFASSLPEDASVGDRYAVITMKGIARTRVEGEIVTVSASVELVVEVTEAYQNWVLFKVNCGKIEVDSVTYTVIGGWWRGSYNKDTNVGNYQGWAQDGDGNNIYFILHTVDLRPTEEGCFMRMKGAFRDSDGTYWALNLLTYRFKLN